MISGEPGPVLPPLARLKLTLTDRCNLACPYCYQRNRRGVDMSPTTLRRALDLAWSLGGAEITVVLSGGEPLLVPHLVADAVALTADHGSPRARLRLLTNGTLLGPALVDRLVDADVALQVSCDGVAASQDDRRPGSLPRLERLLAYIRDRHPRHWRDRVSVAMCVTPRNAGMLAASVAWALDRDVRNLDVNLVLDERGDWGGPCCAVLARELARVLSLSLRHRERTGRLPVRYLRPVPAMAPTAPGADVCGAADCTGLTVAPDGSIHGCAVLAAIGPRHGSADVRRAAAALHVGHVDDPAFAARWRRSERLVRFPVLAAADRASLSGRCRDCGDLEECVVCPLAGSDPHRVPDAHCLFQRLVARQRRVAAVDDPLRVLKDRLRRVAGATARQYGSS